MDDFQYLFRFCCDPGFNDRNEIASLCRYVGEARVDDVMVFANVEEINTGHMTPEEQDVYLRLIADVQAAMHPLGVTTSVNHWHSLMHADFGKKLKEGQNFRLMVDPYGNQAELCVCPLCENWQEYLCALYARYASLHPTFLWVEDDFRFHNHDPLVWGGCFCEEHMKLYSRLAGKELTREEFVKGVLEPGGVHPYRKIWLDVCRQTLVDVAEKLGAAVHAVSPQTKLSLMSSAPHIHAAEGRDWAGILKGLACGNTPVNRTHLPAYVEPSPHAYQMNFNVVSMMTRAFVPPETEIYPELENFPYSRFAKSRRFTRFQMLGAMPLNLSGITIDLYDLEGNGIVWEEGYQDTLSGVKDYLNRLTRMGLFRRKPQGVRVMVSPDSAYSLHTAAGKAMEELYPQEMFFGALLPAFGIPFAYCTDPEVSGQIVSVSGQYFRNLQKEQIERLFARNYVVLSGDTAMTLYEMGLGDLCRMKGARWWPPCEGWFSYEQASDGRVYCGMENARASALVVFSDVLDIRYGEPVETLTMLYDSFRFPRMAGHTVVGGRVLVCPYGRFNTFPEMPAMFLNNIRQAVLQGALSRAKDVEIPPMVLSQPYLTPYYYKMDDAFALYLVNASTDDAEKVRLRLPEGCAFRSIIAYSSLDNGESRPVYSREEQELTISLPVRSMESVLLLFPQ